jgi:hypothetical protein
LIVHSAAGAFLQRAAGSCTGKSLLLPVAFDDRISTDSCGAATSAGGRYAANVDEKYLEMY